MNKDKNILNQFKKTKKPNVPVDFFEQFAIKIMSEVEEEGSLLKSIKKQELPNVPNGYFDEFTDNLKLPQQHKGQLISLKSLAIFTAIAASLLLLFVINFDSSNAKMTEHQPNLLKAETTSYQDEEYLSYLDEDDLVEFIIENDIDVNNSIYINDDNQDDLFDELETELDDYIYEL